MLEPVRLNLGSNSVRLIDQRCLPGSLEYLDIKNVEDMFDAIHTLTVRGAPAIGIAASSFLALEAHNNRSLDTDALKQHLARTAERLAQSRPTAVNLFNALERVLEVIRRDHEDCSAMVDAVVNEALRIHEEDLEASRRMGRHGAALIENGASCLTHCNAGGLATGGLGTALAVFYAAKDAGRNIHVFVDETRPLLQGARLTAFELKQNGIPCTLICDNMAGWMMKEGRVDAVFTGADRVARNGDAANKIGTYSLAILAAYHHVPFYIVAPISTFDKRAATGDDIPIEERDAGEVCGFRSERTSPEGTEVRNPAFDVTPAQLITCIVTEEGVLGPPFEKTIGTLLNG